MSIINLLDVILLVLFGYWNIPSSGLKLDRDKLTETIFSRGESLVNDICNIILTETRKSV